MLVIDASLDNGKHELYETSTGGESWTSIESSRFPKEKQASGSAWRVRTDAATHSYLIEKSENSRWQKIASFLVTVAACKE